MTTKNQLNHSEVRDDNVCCCWWAGHEYDRSGAKQDDAGLTGDAIRARTSRCSLRLDHSRLA